MRSKRLFVVPFALAVFFGVFAGAQQTQPRQFSDVPAGHWARQAVEFAVQCGLVEGFPDGTFRGNSGLTRYQVALIFFRMFEQQRSASLSQECRLGAQQAAQSVGPELQALTQRFEQLETASRDRETRLAALETEVRAAAQAAQQVQALSTRLDTLEGRVQQLGAQPAQPQAQTPPAQEGPTAAELQARIAALEQQVRTLSSASAPQAQPAQPAQPGPEVAALEARIATLETQVRTQAAAPAQPAVPAQPAAAAADTAALEARIGALETQARQQAAAPAQPAPNTAALESRIAALEARPAPAAPNTSALEGRINTLEQQARNQPAAVEPARVSALEEQVRVLNTQVGELRAAQAPPAATPPAAAPTPPAPSAEPELRPAPAAPARRVPNFYLGAGVGLTNALASGDLGLQLNGGGFVGLRSLLLGFGLRAGANYNFNSGALAGQFFLTRDSNPGGFNPYLGLGATVGLSGDTNIYGTALLGVDLLNLGPLGLFAEVTPQFLGNGFGIGAKAGLKLNF
ncbi:MAG: S-layer homology domain-containing protein [Meiothermus sp.]|nr:S-layer homology domain-containing protein [Meiothermus sp.]